MEDIDETVEVVLSEAEILVEGVEVTAADASGSAVDMGKASGFVASGLTSAMVEGAPGSPLPSTGVKSIDPVVICVH